jgi:hypothetical protein
MLALVLFKLCSNMSPSLLTHWTLIYSFLSAFFGLKTSNLGTLEEKE